MKATTVAIIVASHRPYSMEQLAQRLTQIITADPLLSVVIVTDYNPSLLQKQFGLLQWDYVPDHSIARKRNHGITLAGAEIIGFTDDDCLPQEDWVACARDYLDAHPESCAVEGQTVICSQQGAADSLHQYRRLEKPGFRTNNIFYRRAALIAAGMFDERFRLQREDIDLALSVLEQKGKIDFCDSIRVGHALRTNEPWDLLKNCWNRRFDPLLYKKHRIGYRRQIGSPFPGWLGLVGAVQMLFLASLAGAFPYPQFPGILCAVTLFAAVAARRGWCGGNLLDLPRECLAMVVAPALLLTALIHGSIKYRSFLVI